MAFETLLVERHERVGLIRLNRPKALNALNSDLIGELNVVLDADNDNGTADGAGIVTLPYPADDGLLNRLVT